MTQEEEVIVGSEVPLEYPTENDGVPDDEKITRVTKDVVLGELVLSTEEELASKKQFWPTLLKEQGIKYIVAPMVDQSELAFRVLLRAHGAHLTFTPMIHAHLFVNDTTYRKNALAFCQKDRPVVVQFCANKPDTLRDACRLVEGFCDGVDLNLGCPQMVAKRGHYGSFLQDEVDLICSMVSAVRDYCRLPISCKIRVRDSREQTKEYARRLVDAGATMLTVHGRTREMKGVDTGLADWSRICDVVDTVDVPVIANGNIQMPGDVERCMAATGAVGVMSAEGILNNPRLFSNAGPARSHEVAAEYLDYARRFQAGISAIRAHVFRICHHSLLEHADLRHCVSVAHSWEGFREMVEELKKRSEEAEAEEGAAERVQAAEQLWQDIREGARAMVPGELAATPHWLTKPYFRLSELAKETQGEGGQSAYKTEKKERYKKLAEETGMSITQIRRREKRKQTLEKVTAAKKVKFPPCGRCGQPAGQGCKLQHCKKCCRWASREKKQDCPSHRYVYYEKPLAEVKADEAKETVMVEN